MSARVPMFPVSKQDKDSRWNIFIITVVSISLSSRLKSPVRGMSGPGLPGPGGNSAWWHSRMYHPHHPDSGSSDNSKGGFILLSCSEWWRCRIDQQFPLLVLHQNLIFDIWSLQKTKKILWFYNQVFHFYFHLSRHLFLKFWIICKQNSNSN